MVFAIGIAPIESERKLKYLFSCSLLNASRKKINGVERQSKQNRKMSCERWGKVELNTVMRRETLSPQKQ